MTGDYHDDEPVRIRNYIAALEARNETLDAALRGFVDIMRDDGHTDLTAEQVIGMVDVVRLSRRISAALRVGR